MCPVLPADLGNTVALQGKRGPKGEPGSPANGERGLPVSPTLETSPFSAPAAGVQPLGDPAAPVGPLAEIGTRRDIFYLLIIPLEGATCLFTSGLCLCTFFFFNVLIAEAAPGKSPISRQDLILAGRSHFKKNYTSSESISASLSVHSASLSSR